VDKDSTDNASGVVVKEVFKGSAADSAGIRAGDRILTIDGRWTDSVVELFETAAMMKPGQAVPVKLLRDGKEMKVNLTPSKGL
jgi:S1-C subfamily serine protease